jgi:protein involved in polysaccharide export with SLBB domain
MRYRFYLFTALALLSLPVSILAQDGPADQQSLLSSAAASANSSQTTTINTSANDVRPPAQRNADPYYSEMLGNSAKMRGPIVARKSSFQIFAETATSKELDVYGRDLFQNVPSTFAPLQAVQVNPDYVIGAGDALQIRGWGMVDIDVNVTVARSGEVYIPHVGSVKVAGVRYSDLQAYLKKAVGRIFTNFDLSASISQTRSVQVYVVGHALRPGSYTLSAMSSLLNALFLSGGPSETGTMRNIKVRRSGQPVMTFDLYDVLINGDKSSDITLRDGDVIYISEVGPQVALIGNVKKPAIYELKQESSLAELVSWAGGFDSAAAFKNVIVEKGIDSRYETVAEVKADRFSVAEQLSKLPVRPTDIIRVTVPDAMPMEVKVNREFVRVDGEVNKSGVYELQKGETLKSLVARVGGVTGKAYVYGTRLSRESVKKSQQEKIDEVAERYEKDIETSAKQRLASTEEAGQTQAIQSELEAQQRIAQKLRKVKAEGRIILNLRNSSAKVGDLPELPLKDGDVVYIPQLPTTVDVIGAVYQQNTFIWQDSKGVSNYVAMAGGVSATGDRGELYRICADGTVRSRRQGGGGRVNPGDAIVVPEKLQRGKTFTQNLKDWTAILYQFGLGVASLQVLKTL